MHPSSPSSPPQLPAVRDLELVAACEDLKLDRLVTWITQVVDRPADVCEVAVLAPDVYVHLARKMHVRFEGPPTPNPLSPRTSICSDGGGTSGDGAGGIPGRSTSSEGRLRRPRRGATDVHELWRSLRHGGSGGNSRGDANAADGHGASLESCRRRLSVVTVGAEGPSLASALCESPSIGLLAALAAPVDSEGPGNEQCS